MEAVAKLPLWKEQLAVLRRIEVVRVLLQIAPDEEPAELIQDPWRVIECPSSQAPCVAEFSDSEFTRLQRSHPGRPLLLGAGPPGKLHRNQLLHRRPARGGLHKLDPAPGVVLSHPCAPWCRVVKYRTEKMASRA